MVLCVVDAANLYSVEGVQGLSFLLLGSDKFNHEIRPGSVLDQPSSDRFSFRFHYF